jgi:hypothetical protein
MSDNCLPGRTLLYVSCGYQTYYYYYYPWYLLYAGYLLLYSWDKPCP